MFGEEKWALGAGTLAVTFAILVFSEITPKIIGATHADRLALFLGYVLTPLLRLFYPAVWFINLFASALLRLLRLSPEPNAETARLSPEELRSLVLDSEPPESPDPCVAELEGENALLRERLDAADAYIKGLEGSRESFRNADARSRP